jgi:hypothetical protein
MAVYLKITVYYISEDRSDMSPRSIIYYNKSYYNRRHFEHHIAYNLEYFIWDLERSCFLPEDGNSVFFRNVHIHLQVWTVSHTGIGKQVFAELKTLGVATFRMAWMCVVANGWGRIMWQTIPQCKWSPAGYMKLINPLKTKRISFI